MLLGITACLLPPPLSLWGHLRDAELDCWRAIHGPYGRVYTFDSSFRLTVPPITFIMRRMRSLTSVTWPWGRWTCAPSRATRPSRSRCCAAHRAVTSASLRSPWRLRGLSRRWVGRPGSSNASVEQLQLAMAVQPQFFRSPGRVGPSFFALQGVLGPGFSLSRACGSRFCAQGVRPHYA